MTALTPASFPLYLRPTRTDKVRFADGSTSDYTPPSSTVDPRYEACTEHRVGCDCREADLREDIVDIRADYTVLKAAVERVVGDHPTYLEPEPSPNNTGASYKEKPGCQCTGCQIVRLVDSKDFWRTVPR
jgi:hypothetical protein